LGRSEFYFIPIAARRRKVKILSLPQRTRQGWGRPLEL
jgi:hypothetical protein